MTEQLNQSADRKQDLLDGSWEQGADAFTGVSEISPEELEQRYRFALNMLAEDDPSSAVWELQYIHTIIGDEPALMLNLGIALTTSGRLEEALVVLRRLVEQTPEDAEAHYRLAEALRLAVNYQESLQAYQRCLSLDPWHLSAFRNIVVWALENGDVEMALEYAGQACERTPEDHELWLNLATAREAANDFPAAKQAYQKALEFSSLNFKVAGHLASIDAANQGIQPAIETWQAWTEENPDDLSALFVLSLLLERSGQRDFALEHLSVLRVLVQEANCTALCNLAKAYCELSAYSEAEGIYAEAYELEPDNLEVLEGWAQCLSKIARYSSNYHVCQEGLELDPDNLVLQSLKACAEQHLGWHRQARDYFLESIFQNEEPGILKCAMSVLPYDYTITLETLLEVGQRFQQGDPAPTREFYNLQDKKRPLRIGLLSGCLGQHPVGWLTVAAFEGLPKDSFSLHVFSTRRRNDYLNRRFRVCAESWSEYTSNEMADIARDIYSAGIDILIDLGGYGDGGTPGVLLRKPAPVIIKWVGNQACSIGLDAVDWMITDSVETPEGFEDYYTEKLLRLPDGYICYTPPLNIPEPHSLPALENGYVTFGCFNNLCKVNDETLELWSRVLKRVPNSRLIVKARAFEEAETCEIFLERFAKYGIEADRLELRGASPHEEMMRQYADMDIALDPVPYTGGLTTCESLYMGVPVVTVPFRTFASRHSASHMTNVGLSDWVAEEGDLDQFVEIAVAKVNDLEGLSRLREGLREQVLASPLCDAPKFGKNLEKALRHAWTEWCDSQVVAGYSINSQPNKSTSHEWFNVVERMLATNVPAVRKSHGLPNKLVVSLTSYPKRFQTLHLTLKSLLAQTVKPDHLVLWIADGDRKALPKEVLMLEKCGVEISYCEDIRSYKKIIPALIKYKNHYIVTADDDIYYWPTWLEELVSANNGGENVIPAHRIHRINLDSNGEILPYNKWLWNFSADKSPNGLNFPTSGLGVLYPPDAFHEDVTREELFNELCPDADDIWLYFMARLKGFEFKPFRSCAPFYNWPGSQGEALWHQNLSNKKNDQKISSLKNYYKKFENINIINKNYSDNNVTFIVGCGRSGNTLLRKILVERLDIFIPSENYSLLNIINIFSNNNISNSKMIYLSLESYINSDKYNTVNCDDIDLIHEYINNKNNKITINQFYIYLYEYIAKKEGLPSRYFGDKTPLNAFNVSKIIDYFHNPNFIYIERNPYDVVNSYLKSGLYEDVEEALYRWIKTKNILDFHENKHSENFVRIRYEELVKSPDKFINIISNKFNINKREHSIKDKIIEKLGDVNKEKHHSNVKKDVFQSSIGRGMLELDKFQREKIKIILEKEGIN